MPRCWHLSYGIRINLFAAGDAGSRAWRVERSAGTTQPRLRSAAGPRRVQLGHGPKCSALNEAIVRVCVWSAVRWLKVSRGPRSHAGPSAFWGRPSNFSPLPIAIRI